MSNGFYFVPQTLYDLLEKQAQGRDVHAELKTIVTDFLARRDNAWFINNYIDHQPYNPKAMDGDKFDYPSFWRHVDKAGLDAKPGTGRDKVMSAALQYHFNKAAANKGPDANALKDGLPVHIKSDLYARMRQQSLDTRTSMADIITTHLRDYLAAPLAFEKPVSYKTGDSITVFTYRPDAELLDRIDAVLAAHQVPLRRVDRRDIVSIAVDAGLRRADVAAENATTASQRRGAMLKRDPRFRL